MRLFRLLDILIFIVLTIGITTVNFSSTINIAERFISTCLYLIVVNYLINQNN